MHMLFHAAQTIKRFFVSKKMQKRIEAYKYQVKFSIEPKIAHITSYYGWGGAHIFQLFLCQPGKVWGKFQPRIVCPIPYKAMSNPAGTAGEFKNRTPFYFSKYSCPEIQIIFFPPMNVIIATSIVIDRINGFRSIFQEGI